MLHGDISNHRSFAIGVRCESTLFHMRRGILPFSFRLKHSEVDKEVLSLVNYLYWNTEMTVMLVIDDSHYTGAVKEFLMDYPFSQVCNIRSISEITMMLNTGYLSYFITNDMIEKQSVNSQYAMDAKTFNTILRRA